MAPPKGIAPLRRPHRADKKLRFACALAHAARYHAWAENASEGRILYSARSIPLGLCSKKQPAYCELFLWHHQRESLRFAVRIERTKNYVSHVRWHMRLAITPGRKMLPKVAFYIPPVRFLWVYAQKNNPLIASCFYGTTKGNRTLVFGVRGQRPDR